MTLDPLVPIPAIIAIGAAFVLVAAVRLRGARRPVVHTIAIAACVAFIAVDPAIPGGRAEARRAAADVLFVVDATASMGAIDFADGQPRLDGVRTDILDLADEFPGAHFALIRFDTQSRVELPWTTDLAALQTAVTVMGPERSQLSRGSRLDLPVPTIGEMLPRPRADDSEAYTVLFYFSDGEERTDSFPERPVFGQSPDLEFEVTDPPTTFAELEPLVSAGAVFGYGTAEGAPMLRLGDPQPRPGTEEAEAAEDLGPFVRDFETDAPAISRYDETNLVEIADDLALPSVHRTGPGGVAAIAAEIAAAAPMVSDGSRATPERLYWIGALALLPLLFIQLRRAIGELKTAGAAFAPRPPQASAAPPVAHPAERVAPPPRPAPGSRPPAEVGGRR